MPRVALARLSEALLEEERSRSGSRFVPMAMEMRLEATDEVLLSVGGTWDRRCKDWTGTPGKVRVLRVHPGQEAAARWFVDWFQGYAGGQAMSVYTAAHIGGRRSGKTELALYEACLFAVGLAFSTVAVVAPTVDEGTGQLIRGLQRILPADWYTPRAEPPSFLLRNGSQILILSAQQRLKRGRLDFVVADEAQSMPKRAYIQLRGSTADTGGLVVLAANPPDEAEGWWLAELVEETDAQRRAETKVFWLHSRQNPHIDYASLLALRSETDDASWRREVLGELVRPGDLVCYGWSTQLNVLPPPSLEGRLVGEVTRKVTERAFGRQGGYGAVVGCDFQLQPMVGVVARFFVDPDDPQGELLWITDEVLLDQADEHGLLDALEAKGLSPEDTVVIADASGAWQDAERTKGRASFDILRSRGWRHLFTPDRAQKKNPPILERALALNARIRAADGRRRLFSTPENVGVNRALAGWPMTNGAPSRISRFAHACDAVSYIVWRFYPRRQAQSEDPGYKRLEKPHREDIWGGRGL